MDEPPKQPQDDIYINLFESEKFRLMGKMASGVAHEINNPIMIIQNYVSLILDEIHEKNQLVLTPGCESYSYLQEILEECERIAKITKNLLEFTRSKSKFAEISNLENILLSVVKLMQPMIVKAQIKLNLKINTSQPLCLVHSDQIKQVFVNIIDNAVFALQMKAEKLKKSTKENLLIEISVSEKVINQKEGKINYLVVEFYDNGIGIEKDLQKHIFKPFFSTKRTKEMHPQNKKFQGLGLGLAYCKKVIQNHSGFIDFDSEPDQYSKFRIYLPKQLQKITKSVQKPKEIGNKEKSNANKLEEESEETIVF